MLVRVTPINSRKRLAHYVMYTSAKHVGHVHDVAGTDWQTQNGSTRASQFLPLSYTDIQKSMQYTLLKKSKAALFVRCLSIEPIMLLRLR